MIDEACVRGVIQKSSSSDTRIAHCFLCLTHISSANEPVAGNRNITNRFFVLLERYLASSNPSSSSNSPSSKQQLIGNTAMENAPVCDECFKIVDSFCDLYNEVKKLELKLEWKVWKLKSTMVGADLLPSRMTSLRAFYMDKENNRIGIPDKISNYRRRVISKCNIKLQRGFPRVSLKKVPIVENSMSTSSSRETDEEVVPPIDSAQPEIGVVDVSDSELLCAETDVSSAENIPSKFSNISGSKTNSKQFRNEWQLNVTSGGSEEIPIDKGKPANLGAAEESLSRSVISVVGTFQVPTGLTSPAIRLDSEPLATHNCHHHSAPTTVREDLREVLRRVVLRNMSAQCGPVPPQEETECTYSLQHADIGGVLSDDYIENMEIEIPSIPEESIINNSVISTVGTQGGFISTVGTQEGCISTLNSGDGVAPKLTLHNESGPFDRQNYQDPSSFSSYNALHNPSYPSTGTSRYPFFTGHHMSHHTQIPSTLNIPVPNLQCTSNPTCTLPPVLNVPTSTFQSTPNSTTTMESTSNVHMSNLQRNFNTNLPDMNPFTSGLTPGVCPSRGLDPRNCECGWCSQYRKMPSTATPKNPGNFQEPNPCSLSEDRIAYLGNHGDVSNDNCTSMNTTGSGSYLQQTEQPTVSEDNYNAMDSASTNNSNLEDDGDGCSYTNTIPESSDDDDDDSEIDYKDFQIKPEPKAGSSESDSDSDVDEKPKLQPREKITTPADQPSTISSSSDNQSLGKKDGLKCPLCFEKFVTLKKLVVHFLSLHFSKELAVTWDHYTRDKISVICIEMQVLNSRITNEQSASSFEELVLEKLKQLHPCNIKDCFEVFASSEELETHSKLHGEFKCTYCDVTSDFAPDLAIHEWQQHSISQSKEPEDGSSKLASIDDGEGLAKKSKNKCQYKYQCPRCSFRFNNVMLFVHHHLLEHMRLQMNIRTCNICKHEFMVLSQREFKGALEKHIKSHHNIAGGIDSSSIKRCDHQDQCSAFFLTVNQLIKHNIHVHQNSSLDKVCKDCGKVFPGKRGRRFLRLHRISKHKAELKFHCSETGCKNTHFETESDLYYHMQAHRLKHDPVKCPQCGKTCLGKSGLKNHIKFTHTIGKKPKQRKFVCEHCGKAFKEKTYLDTHYLSHSGPATWEFMCSMCSKKCLTKQKLDEHMRTHTKEQPFVCQYCGVKYAHRHNLRIHVNNKHGDVAKEVPRPFDRTNLSSKKGKRLKKISNEINEECSSSE